MSSKTSRLVLPYPPSVNHAYKRGARGTILTETAAVYKHEAGWRAKEQGVQFISGDVALYVDFYRPVYKPDLDNGLKLLIDSLNGIAWEDDSQLVEIHARRFDDPANPRVNVVIKEVPVRKPRVEREPDEECVA